MLMLPVPAFIAVCLAFLTLRTLLSGGRQGLALFLAACALQSLGIALAAGFGFVVLRPMLPVTAAVIPALAWITFMAGLIRPLSWSRDVWHLGGPLFCLFCRLFAPETTDIAVAALFGGYGLAILRSLAHTADLPLARIEAGVQPRRLWLVIGALLIASAVGDLLIAVAFLAGHQDWAGGLISLLSSVILLCIGGLSSVPEAGSAEEEGGTVESGKSLPPGSGEDLQAEDQEIVARLDALLRESRIYLDPDLTLQRLARRLHLPDKRLSAAVNRATGANLSRHINGWRITHACDLIATGRSITEVMFASGFNTKSNFNREFLRIKGLSPGAWARIRSTTSVSGAE
ncbi:AraC family transcriptional regulator [Paracoccaceae bacterium]